MSFPTITEFRNHYGERTTTIARYLEKLMLKMINIESHVKFLQEYKNYNVIRRGMMIKNTNNVYKNKRFLKETMCKVRDNILGSRRKQLRQNRTKTNTQ